MIIHSSGAHRSHRNSGMLRKRCKGEKTTVPEEKLLSVRLLGPPEISFEGRGARQEHPGGGPSLHAERAGPARSSRSRAPRTRSGSRTSIPWLTSCLERRGTLSNSPNNLLAEQARFHVRIVDTSIIP